MPLRILFQTDSEKEAEQFVREYVLDAVDRIPEIESCDNIGFGLNEPPNPDGGSVMMTVDADADKFVQQEKERWEQAHEMGLITGWETTAFDEVALAEEYGENGAELAPRLGTLAEKMAAHVYDEFDDLDNLPATVDTFPDEHTEIGWWFIPHHLTFASLGYSATEELSVHMAGVEEALRIIAERGGEQKVDTEIDDLIEALEEMRDDVKEGRQKG